MNKEEINKAIKVVFNEECKECYFPKRRRCTSCVRENRKKIKKYIKELEQKESILDKVTEFIKDDVTAEDIRFEGSKLFSTVYKSLISKTKEKIAECINSYKDEIEDIIEGEKK